jgi:hypothetical protein
MEIKNIDEIQLKVKKKLEVSYYYTLFGLLEKKISEFDEKEINTLKDIELLLALRKYLGIGKKNETYKSFSKEIKENLSLV